MKHTLTYAIITAFCLTTVALANVQQSSQGDESQQPGQVAQKEEQKAQISLNEMKKSAALNYIHHVNEMGIELSKIARAKSQSEEVKQISQQMLQAHQDSEQLLNDLSKRENVKISKYQPADYEKTVMDQLKDMTGQQFDQAYLQTMRASHEMAARDLRALKASISDPQIKSYISDSLAGVQKYKKTISKMSQGKSMQKQAAGTASKSTY